MAANQSRGTFPSLNPIRQQVSNCFVDSFDELMNMIRGHLRCYTNQERLRICVSEKSEAGICV